jgi:hypothetical protein
MTKKTSRIRVEDGSDNVFRDLGRPIGRRRFTGSSSNGNSHVMRLLTSDPSIAAIAHRLVMIVRASAAFTIRVRR